MKVEIGESSNAVFKAGQDSKFIYNNITVEADGVSKYKVCISYGDEDTVYCKVPSVYILLLFLESLTSKRPLFIPAGYGETNQGIMNC